MQLKDLIENGKLTADVLFHAGQEPYVISVMAPAGTTMRVAVDGDYVLRCGNTVLIVHPDTPADGRRVHVTIPPQKMIILQLPMLLSRVKAPVIVDGVEYANGSAATKAILASDVKTTTVTIKLSACAVTVGVEVDDYIENETRVSPEDDDFVPHIVKEVYIIK